MKLSAQGLDKRFTNEAGAFLKIVLEAAAGQIIVAERFDYGCAMNPRQKKPNIYQKVKTGRAFS